jgi:CRISPR-associated endonuclease/helicase Cas3
MAAARPASGSDLFDALFTHATDGGGAYPYQKQLATAGPTDSHLLSIPTGLGKTAAAILAWVWRRRFAGDVRESTPRRLVYCLPMRVLAEQTYSEAIRWLDRLGLLAGQASWDDPANDRLPRRTSRLLEYSPDSTDSRELGWAGRNGAQGSGRIAVHLLMGGEERTEWAYWPEREAVLVGTQDMLLSRALNRGYASRRPRWPIEFGLLNNDCLWVFDEVQLLGPGLATGLQLEAFRSSDIAGKTYFGTERRCVSWYMSATASQRMLASREWRDGEGDRRPSGFLVELSPEERSDTEGMLGQRRLATKRLESQPSWTLDDADAAQRILTRHQEMVSSLREAPAAVPRRTLIICNTVKRAMQVHAALRGELGDRQSIDLVLLHSRFRPPDRARQQERLKAIPDAGQIVVATQVVEAGVDLSSAILWTEVAPLPSIVQRLGRLNRGGEFGHGGCVAVGWTPVVVVVGVPLPSLSGRPTKDDHERETTRAYLPYDRGKCEAAMEALGPVADASPASLETHLRPQLESTLRPPDSSLQRHELLDFFDTDSNLSLGYTDVSSFVRGADPETDIYVVWREWDGERPPFDFDIGRKEICQVPVGQALAKNSPWRQGFIWLGRERGWHPATRDNLLPGATLLLPVQAGGYDDGLGWTGTSNGDTQVTDLYVPLDRPTGEDLLSGLAKGWQSIESHTRDVRRCSEDILDALSPFDEAVRGAIAEAIRWHDYGKAIEGWQDATRRVAAEARLTWPDQIAPIGKFSFAESPLLDRLTGPELWREVWRLKRAFAPGLRHEVASALALRQHHRKNNQEPTIHDLLAEYLVMSHHGHVRKTLRDELPRDPRRIRRGADEVRGIREGMRVPGFPLDGQPLPETPALSIACRQMGRGVDGSESWTRSVLRLLDCFGPFRLAYYEAVVRAADSRASANPCTGVVTAQPRSAADIAEERVSGGAQR